MMYKHKSLPALGVVAEQQTVDEFRRVERALAALAGELDLVKKLLVFAAYANMVAPDDTAMSDLGAAYQDLDFLAQSTPDPRGISILPDGQFSFQHKGTYALLITGSLGHNSFNDGRLLNLRLYDYTDGYAVGSGITVGTGRNAESTPLSTTLIAEITENGLNKALGLQIGGGDSYGTVEMQALGIGIFNVGEVKDPIEI